MRILGSGSYLPKNRIGSRELEKELGYPEGTFSKASGVNTRYFVAEETASEMGALAAIEALKSADIHKEDIDVVVSVSGVPQQAIPSTASLIHGKLGMKGGFAFDINSTCLSFLTGLNLMAPLINSGVYKNVLLVAADVASGGLNPSDPKTASLFGDGAAAIVLGPSEGEGVIASHFEMRSDGGKACECQAGGTRLGLLPQAPKEELFFRMNGPRLFKEALPPFMKIAKNLMEKVGGAVDMIIPHQASPFALDLVQKKLGICSEQFIHIVRDYGNMIATSLPFAFDYAIRNERVKRGDRILFLGTGAGLTIGGLVLDY